MPYKVTVIGAVNVDICGKPSEKFVAHDSNVGSVSHTIGGVGFNVARNLSLLGAQVRFVAALGNDSYLPEIEAEAKRFSIDMSLCRRMESERNSVYLFVTDEHGDMLAAVNDMRINRHLNKDFFKPIINEILTATLLLSMLTLKVKRCCFCVKISVCLFLLTPYQRTRLSGSCLAFPISAFLSQMPLKRAFCAALRSMIMNRRKWLRNILSESEASVRYI